MKVIKSVAEWRALRQNLSLTKTLGFVPTMGALHKGHASLLELSKGECDQTVLSIFVNSTQFDKAEDFDKYPRTIEADLELAQKQGVDYVLCPAYEDLFTDGFRYRAYETEVSELLCGPFRPGHFQGVLTVVLKLLNLVRPSRAYFGEKDFQQLELIRGMVEAFFIPVLIVGAPTVREEDGLALSSRNLRLSTEQRLKAARLNQILRQNIGLSEKREALTGEGLRVEYLTEWRGRLLVSAYLGSVRLIDNIKTEEVLK